MSNVCVNVNKNMCYKNSLREKLILKHKLIGRIEKKKWRENYTKHMITDTLLLITAFTKKVFI